MTISRARKQSSSNFTIPWKSILKSILFFIFIATGYSMMDKVYQANYFPIREVNIFGIHHTNHQEVQTLLTPLVKQGFFAVDIDRVKERLQQSPWVAKAYVQRVWPDIVSITLEEKIPLARWNKSNLLSATGEIFSPDINTYPDDIPNFVGPLGEQVNMMQYYKKINGLLAPLHFKILRLELAPSLAWNITFENGIKMSLGHKDILTHIGHFVKVYPKIVGNRATDVDYIDLRYPNGLAVRWKSS